MSGDDESRVTPADQADGAGGSHAGVGFPVVGIGGSAGALPALLRFFAALPPRTGMAFVVVLHLSPDHESRCAEILQGATSMPVRQIRAKTRLEPDHVYVIPPGFDLLTEDGHVQPASRPPPRRSTGVIDVFFRTLADVHRDHAIGIVLSGTGSDGSVGISRIKEAGGITVTQSPEDAEFDEMPTGAVATGYVDFVLPAAEIAGRLVELWKNAQRIRLPAEPGAEGKGADDQPAPEAALEEVLQLLRFHTRNDFRRYKRATVLRRVARRMQIHGLPEIADYRDHLKAHPEEAGPLLQDMLISVTSFFRDPPAFESLERLAVPTLFGAVVPGDDLRVWVAGCATGEESYSIGIVLREHAERLTQPPKIQIFATDINERALAVGRQGVYPSAIATDVSPTRLARYFQADGDQYRVAGALRDQVLFAKHNLIADPPFSRIDLICCRNLLIYLDNAAQRAVLEMFSYALRPGGLLFLGNAESADAAPNLFASVDPKHRIFRLNADPGRSARMPSHFAPESLGAAPMPLLAEPKARTPLDKPAALLHQRALLRLAAPSVLIDENHEVLHLSAGVAEHLGRDQGTPSNNLLDNVPPDVRLELRTAIFRAEERNETARARVRRTLADGSAQELGLCVHPVHQAADEPRRWLVVFETSVPPSPSTLQSPDATQLALFGRLQDENRELKSHLQETLDRSASSSEGFKAANEELQAINEELRSATEELETSKEELQSMNEELTTVNFELRLKVDESARTNDDLRNLMAASDIATIFVDGGLRIKRFTPQATKLFQLIASDVGRPLLDIRNRLRYPELEDDALAVFQTLRPLERRIDGVDDRHYFARVLPYRTALNKIEGAVLTFVDMTDLQQAEERVLRVEERLRDAVEFSADFFVITTDDAGLVVTWNAGAEAIFGYAADEIIGRSIDGLFNPDDRAAGVPEAERRKARETGRAEDERWHIRKDGTLFFCGGVMTPLRTGFGTGSGFAKIGRDVTASRSQAIANLSELDQERRLGMAAKAASDLKDQFLAVMSHELKQPLNLIQVNAELLTRLPETQSIDAARRIGDTIQRAVDTQTQIVDDLLDLSRMRTGKLRLHLEPVDISEIVRMLADAAAGDLQRKGIALDISQAINVVCSCDRVRVEQIVWNLLSNAIKFTPAGGRIRIKVADEHGFARLSVADSGVGIAKEFLPQVFDMFSQGASPHATGLGGTGNLGIGLALVEELSRAHGGRAEAASDGPGEGSTFTVWLPLGSAQAAADAASRPGVDLTGMRVLLVDDDADSLTTFGMLLEMEGAVVVCASTGRDALEHLRAEPFDLLVSDLGMPDMNGLALIAEVRTLPDRQALKAVAVSGYGREVDVQRALRAGFDAHVPKPASMDKLKAAIGRM